MKYFVILLLLLACFAGSAHAQTCNGASPNWAPATASQADFNACMAKTFACGDTVTVPSGTFTWSLSGTSPTLPAGCSPGQGLTIQGATVCTGTGDPNIGGGTVTCTDNTILTFSNQAMILVGCSTTSFIRMTGFTIIDTFGSANGSTRISGGTFDNKCFRFDHNHYKSNSGGADLTASDSYGLIDHNLFEDTGTSGARPPLVIKGSNNDRGYSNWNEATVPGSGNAIYVEQNEYLAQNAGSTTEGFWDAYAGAKVVDRSNHTVNTGSTGGHGLDSNQSRSVNLVEMYQDLLTNSTSATVQPIGSRGGVYMVWGNTMNKSGTGGFSNIGQSLYRYLSVNQPSNWGMAIPGANWIPVGVALTNASNGYVNQTLNAPDWQASHSYAANTPIGPLSNNSGNQNFITTAACTSGSSRPTFPTGSGNTVGDNTCTWTNISGVLSGDFRTSHAYSNQPIIPLTNNAGGFVFFTTSSCTSGGSYPGTWNQTVGGTTNDGGCTWTNTGGKTTGNWCAVNPDTIASSDTTCNALHSGDTSTRFLDTNGGVYPYRDQPGVGHNQVVMGDYEWLNGGTGFVGQPFFGICSGCSSVIAANRDYYDYQTTGCSGTQSMGVCSGTLAARAANCTTGVGYWATDQGSWNVSGNGAGNGVFYKCTATNTWTVYYTPYTYPDPLEGGFVTVSPSSQNFGSFNLNTSSNSVTFTATNGSTSSMTLVSVSVTGTNQADFAISNNTCLTTLTAGNSCTWSITFTPSAVGPRAASTSINYNGGDGAGSRTSSLSGTGVLALSPSSYNFGSVNVGSSSSPVPFTLSNYSTAQLTLATPYYFLTDATDYSVTNVSCANAGLVAIGASCSFNITFSPTSAGSKPSTLSVNYSGGDGNTPQIASLSGTGTLVTAATPSCAPGSGTYPSAQSVTCSDASSGAIMCYTLNGATPSTNGASGCSSGTLYSGAILISSTLTLNVIAGGTGYTDSSVATYNYTILPPASSFDEMQGVTLQGVTPY